MSAYTVAYIRRLREDPLRMPLQASSSPVPPHLQTVSLAVNPQSSSPPITWPVETDSRPRSLYGGTLTFIRPRSQRDVLEGRYINDFRPQRSPPPVPTSDSMLSEAALSSLRTQARHLAKEKSVAWVQMQVGRAKSEEDLLQREKRLLRKEQEIFETRRQSTMALAKRMRRLMQRQSDLEIAQKVHEDSLAKAELQSRKCRRVEKDETNHPLSHDMQDVMKKLDGLHGLQKMHEENIIRAELKHDEIRSRVKGMYRKNTMGDAGILKGIDDPEAIIDQLNDLGASPAHITQIKRGLLQDLEGGSSGACRGAQRSIGDEWSAIFDQEDCNTRLLGSVANSDSCYSSVPSQTNDRRIVALCTRKMSLIRKQRQLELQMIEEDKRVWLREKLERLSEHKAEESQLNHQIRKQCERVSTLNAALAIERASVAAANERVSAREMRVAELNAKMQIIFQEEEQRRRNGLQALASQLRERRQLTANNYSSLEVLEKLEEECDAAELSVVEQRKMLADEGCGDVDDMLGYDSLEPFEKAALAAEPPYSLPSEFIFGATSGLKKIVPSSTIKPGEFGCEDTDASVLDKLDNYDRVIRVNATTIQGSTVCFELGFSCNDDPEDLAVRLATRFDLTPADTDTLERALAKRCGERYNPNTCIAGVSDGESDEVMGKKSTASIAEAPDFCNRISEESDSMTFKTTQDLSDDYLHKHGSNFDDEDRGDGAEKQDQSLAMAHAIQKERERRARVEFQTVPTRADRENIACTHSSTCLCLECLRYRVKQREIIRCNGKEFWSNSWGNKSNLAPESNLSEEDDLNLSLGELRLAIERVYAFEDQRDRKDSKDSVDDEGASNWGEIARDALLHASSPPVSLQSELTRANGPHAWDMLVRLGEIQHTIKMLQGKKQVAPFSLGCTGTKTAVRIATSEQVKKLFELLSAAGVDRQDIPAVLSAAIIGLPAPINSSIGESALASLSSRLPQNMNAIPPEGQSEKKSSEPSLRTELEEEGVKNSHARRENQKTVLPDATSVTNVFNGKDHGIHDKEEKSFSITLNPLEMQNRTSAYSVEIENQISGRRHRKKYLLDQGKILNHEARKWELEKQARVKFEEKNHRKNIAILKEEDVNISKRGEQRAAEIENMSQASKATQEAVEATKVALGGAKEMEAKVSIHLVSKKLDGPSAFVKHQVIPEDSVAVRARSQAESQRKAQKAWNASRTVMRLGAKWRLKAKANNRKKSESTNDSRVTMNTTRSISRLKQQWDEKHVETFPPDAKRTKSITGHATFANITTEAFPEDGVQETQVSLSKKLEKEPTSDLTEQTDCENGPVEHLPRSRPNEEQRVPPVQELIPSKGDYSPSGHFWLEKFKAFYLAHDPEKLNREEGFLRMMIEPYKGHETELLAMLEEIYVSNATRSPSTTEVDSVAHNGQDGGTSKKFPSVQDVAKKHLCEFGCGFEAGLATLHEHEKTCSSTKALAKYRRMKEAKLPLPYIRRKMINAGMPPAIIEELSGVVPKHMFPKEGAHAGDISSTDSEDDHLIR